MSYVNNKKKVTKYITPNLVPRQRYQKIGIDIFNQIELVDRNSEVWKRHYYEYNFET